MTSLFNRLALVATAAALSLAVACPADPPPPPPPPAVVDAGPAKPVIPEYAPTGDFADIKKAAAAGIDDTNAAAKATEIEATLDKAIADLKAAAAAAPAAK